MSNYVLQRPTGVRLCTTASGYEQVTSASAVVAGADLGSIRSVVFEATSEMLTATSTKAADAVVATSVTNYQGTLTIELEEITSSAMALLYGMTASGANGSAFYTNGSASTLTNYCLIPYYWPIDGVNYAGLFYKCNIAPGSTRRLGKEQEILVIKATVLCDTDASATKGWFKFIQ
jgi:hypothetical protein